MDTGCTLRARPDVDIVPLVDNEAGVAFRADPPGVVILSRFALLTLLALDGTRLDRVADRFVQRLGVAGQARNHVLRSFWLSVGQLDGFALLEEVHRAA